jgi:outer membrane protein insertion porin family
MKRLSVTALLICYIAFFAQAQFRLGQSYSNNKDVSYGTPQKYEIGGITISGVKFLDQNALISITGLKVGDVITVPGEEISNAIKKLWEQGLLSDVAVDASKIENGRIYLDFQLKERPRLAKFNFKGVKKGEADDLREKINLIRGRVVTDAVTKNAQNIVRKYFVDKGFLNTKVNISFDEDTLLNNSVALTIDVDKNKKVKINDISFTGNEVLTEKQLRRKMKETKESKPYRIFKASKFIRSKYAEDKENLIKHYNSLGYRDAYIVEDTVYAHDENSVNINITINEGLKYYFRNIDWVGNYVYEDNVLGGVLGIKKGDVYNPENLEKRLNYNPTGLDVSSLYLDDGYLFFNVEPVEVLVEGDSIDIEMRIHEGTQANIKRVTIEGNTKTNDHVILREIRTLPGQKFSRTALIRSQREIAQLGYFDPEQIGINPVPNPEDGTVDINYTVVEKPSDQIELSGGWGGYFGFVGTLGLTFNNFSIRKATDLKEWTPIPGGAGQKVSLRLQANGRQFQTYSVSFMEPWLGGKRPNSFSVNLSHSVQNSFTTFGANSKPVGNLQVTGLTVGLGRRLTVPDDYFTLSNSLSYQRYSLYNFNQQFSSRPGQDLGFTTGAANSFSFITTIARNSIDNPTFPTRGSSLSLTINATPPYSLFRENNTFANTEAGNVERYRFIEFHKWMFDGSYFIKLADKLVINARSHFGFLGSYSPDLGVGRFERFQLGGDGITGFNFLLGTDIIGLRGYPNNSIGVNRENGGIIFNKHVTELRYAISTNPAATIYALTFLEAGNNWDSYTKFNPFNLYRSAGVGARIFMPAFGMIGVDYGWGFDKIPNNPNQQKGNFHFTIGQQIR